MNLVDEFFEISVFKSLQQSYKNKYKFLLVANKS